MNRFVLPGSNPGLIVRGNIDIYTRAVVHLADGRIATVRAVSFGIKWKGRNVHVLVPTVVGNRVVSDNAAFRHFERSGAHLGMFDTPSHATAYALRLHKQQALFYRQKQKQRTG